MTGSAPVLDRPALWAALSLMAIAPPEPGLSFEAALADQQGWTRDFAGRVSGEYRRFLYLAAVAGFEVTPSQAVDAAWHLHLALPHYREVLGGRILGRALDHLPGAGTPEDDARCARQYEQTLALYERAFGGPPPSDIWPRPPGTGERGRSNGRGRLGLAAVAAGLVAGLAAPAFGTSAFVPVLLLGAFLLGLLLFPTAVLAGAVARRQAGAGCGGSFGDGGGSCSASCGGGCGGD